MLYQHIQQLLRQRHDKQEILFINFEDERITDIRKEELHLIVECYKEMFACDPIIFLDKIQNVKVYPFSFPEYLEYHHITLDAHWQLAPVRADVVRLFEGYFTIEACPKASATRINVPDSFLYIKRDSIRTS